MTAGRDRRCRGSAFAKLWAALCLLGAAGGCASWMLPAAGRVGKSPELRFVTREDLGLGRSRLEMDIVYTVHPDIRFDGAAGYQDTVFGSRDAFRVLTQNVLGEAFTSAVEIAPGAHLRIEDLRGALPEKRRLVAEVPSLSARVLVLVDFRPPLSSRPDLASQLAVKVYDISYTRYEELSFFNPRLLIFEDFAEVPRPESPARAAGAVMVAWREILGQLRQSDRFRKYSALGRETLDKGSPSGALLLGILSPQRISRTPDPSGHEWVEREILFSRAGEAPAPPSAASPVPAAPPSIPPASGSPTAAPPGSPRAPRPGDNPGGESSPETPLKPPATGGEEAGGTPPARPGEAHSGGGEASGTPLLPGGPGQAGSRDRGEAW